ncbi:hypothetical protein PHYSODRAFT_287114, partial [Phytophthora sojae]
GTGAARGRRRRLRSKRAATLWVVATVVGDPDFDHSFKLAAGDRGSSAQATPPRRHLGAVLRDPAVIRCC